ncbi:TIGR03086 family metal-binding protein [Nocardia sp. alder85J]|uniref:TIGR03086 family metal-binding protein n=1 Tax=Nocardia sp. alder85J TaxID=2862949 RepID=UPI001CD38C74|nr:TIGR03086 family metal-binding protein [Nocardia sp. alder85J]MCX4098256.1 TIGR03086 family metal-binding protein [Nocardia sp. alder85J]
MDVIEMHRRAADHFGARIDRVGAGEWDLRTPCTEWDVRALVDHVVGNHRRMAGLLHGRPFEAVDDEPHRTWPVVVAAVRSGFVVPGALDRTVPLPFGGEGTVTDLLLVLTADLATHTWDLAHAVGADEALDTDLVAALLPAIERAQPAMTASGRFAPPLPVSDTAGPQHRLLALLGRRMES